MAPKVCHFSRFAYFYVFIFIIPCFSFAGDYPDYRTCSKAEGKIVETSHLCNIGDCRNRAKYCSHQIGANGSECEFFKDDCSEARAGAWPFLYCTDGPSGGCRCPPASYGHVPLEDAVTITAYTFECCAADNQYVAVPDIQITNTGWRELAIVSNLSEGLRWCGRFLLSEDASGRILQYDCPTYQVMDQGKDVSLQVCTGDQTATFRFKLPYRNNTSQKLGSLATWEPLIALHTHRADRLVYSVQRAPPRLNISRYQAQLVRCETADCADRRYKPVPDTLRPVTELPAESERRPGVFRLEFDLPEEAMFIALWIQPEGGRPTLSAVLDYYGKNTVQMAIFASLLTLFLLLVIGGIVYFKKFYKPAEPAVVELLVVYNNNAGLARRLSAALEAHCRLRPRLDVVDIPRAGAGMDPVEWFNSELQHCRTVLLLVFPECSAPPIYPRFYKMATHRLQLDAGAKRVVVGHTGGRPEELLSQLPAASCHRLPDQLAGLVRAARGAPWLGRGALDARELGRALNRSAEGRRLAALLERPSEPPPSEEAPLPVAEPGSRAEPTLQLPQPPPGKEDLLAPHVPSTDVVLAPLQPNGRAAAPADSDADSDADIEWH